MAQLRQDYDKFTAVEAVVLILGPEKAGTFESYWKKNEMPFIGLPDPKHEVLKLYGQEVNLFKFGRMPAMVIVDKKGMVRFVHYGHQMSDIPANEEVLQTLRELNQEG